MPALRSACSGRKESFLRLVPLSCHLPPRLVCLPPLPAQRNFTWCFVTIVLREKSASKARCVFLTSRCGFNRETGSFRYEGLFLRGPSGPGSDRRNLPCVVAGILGCLRRAGGGSAGCHV